MWLRYGFALQAQENWMYPSPKNVKNRYSSFGDKAVAFGAAGMVLSAYCLNLSSTGARFIPFLQII